MLPWHRHILVCSLPSVSVPYFRSVYEFFKDYLQWGVAPPAPVSEDTVSSLQRGGREAREQERSRDKEQDKFSFDIVTDLPVAPGRLLQGEQELVVRQERTFPGLQHYRD